MELLGDEYVPSRAAIVEKVSCALARNEYESLQIGVHAIGAELADVRLEVESDLEVKVYHGIEGYKLLDGNVAGGLAAGKNSNFWLTFHATRETPAGMHAGRIRIKPADHEETVLDLEIQVRPFVLNRPRISIGIYYPQGGGDDQKWMAAFKDMAEHGQTSLRRCWTDRDNYGVP